MVTPLPTEVEDGFTEVEEGCTDDRVDIGALVEDIGVLCASDDVVGTTDVGGEVDDGFSATSTQ